jgi:hypothetical protein
MENLLKNLNEVNYLSQATNISVGNLKIGVKYRVLRLDKVETKYGRSIAAHVSNDGDELWRIFIPKKFVNIFDDCFIEQFNHKQMGELFLTYKGTSQKSFNVEFS